MKKQIALLAATLAFTLVLNAQPGGGFQRPPEERAARVHQKLDSAFKLPATELAKLDTVLITLYKAQDARMKEIFTASNGDREAMRETMMAERKKFSDAEDEILKAVLTEDQFKTWKEKIQPSMRPQRPQGAPGGN